MFHIKKRCRSADQHRTHSSDLTSLTRSRGTGPCSHFFLDLLHPLLSLLHTLGPVRPVHDDLLEILERVRHFPLRAEVVVLNGYSAHADRRELARWLGEVRRTSPSLQGVHLVHGEAEAQDALRAQLTADGYTVTCPEPRTRLAFR